MLAFAFMTCHVDLVYLLWLVNHPLHGCNTRTRRRDRLLMTGATAM